MNNSITKSQTDLPATSKDKIQESDQESAQDNAQQALTSVMDEIHKDAAHNAKEYTQEVEVPAGGE